MSFLIAFVCMGLLFYWVSRTRLLLKDCDQIDEILDDDLRQARAAFWSLIRQELAI